MNSTRRTIFAKREAAERDRRHLLAAAAFACVAVIVGMFSGRLALAALNAQAGAAALQDAEEAEIGPARDVALSKAQRALAASVAIAPGDARVWDDLAETYYRQATEAAVGEISRPLLTAAAEAAARGTENAAAVTRLAAILSHDPDRAGQAAEALGRSYVLSPPLSAPGMRRVEAASRVWPQLPPRVRQAALAEVCAEARRDVLAAERVEKLIAAAPDAFFISEARGVLQQYECRPPLLEPAAFAGEAFAPAPAPAAPAPEPAAPAAAAPLVPAQP